MSCPLLRGVARFVVPADMADAVISENYFVTKVSGNNLTDKIWKRGLDGTSGMLLESVEQFHPKAEKGPCMGHVALSLAQSHLTFCFSTSHRGTGWPFIHCTDTPNLGKCVR